MLKSLVAVGLLTCAELYAADSVRILSGGRVMKAVAGADGSIYVLGSNYGSLPVPTPGAWRTALPPFAGLGFYVAHLDAQTGVPIYVTYLPPFQPTALAVDSRGAAVVAGYAVQPVETTPGAFQTGRQGITDIVVLRLNPTGSQAEFISVFGGHDTSFAEAPTAIAITADSAIHLLGHTTAQDFPTTPDALQRQPANSPQRGVFFSQLSADGSALLYSSYVTGGDEGRNLGASFAGDMVTAANGDLYFTGAEGSRTFPYTAGAYRLSMPESAVRHFVARWNPASKRFVYIASVAGGERLYERLTVAVDPQGRAVLGGNHLYGVEGFAPAANGTFAGSTEGVAYLVKLNAEGSAVEWATGLGARATLWGIALDKDNNVTTLGVPNTEIFPSTGAFPVTVGAYSRAGAGFLAQLTADGRRLAYSTRIPVARFGQGTALFYTRQGTVHVLDGDYNLFRQEAQVGASFRTNTEPAVVGAQTAHIYASPAVLDACNSSLAATTPIALIWDVRDSNLESAVVRMGSPDGPIVATGLGGGRSQAPLPIGVTSFYLLDRINGLPGAPPRVLASTTVRIAPADRCRLTPANIVTGFINIRAVRDESNAPNLICLDGSGTQAFIHARSGVEPGDAEGARTTEVRVNAPDGPLFTDSGIDGNAFGTTQDWVANGMLFYVMRRKADGTSRIAAATRVYTLPVFDCGGANPPAVAIAVTPGLIRGLFTLAWNTGRQTQVELRSGSADGEVAGRFDTSSGLLDVTPTGPQTRYFLMEYLDGAWRELSSVTIRP